MCHAPSGRGRSYLLTTVLSNISLFTMPFTPSSTFYWHEFARLGLLLFFSAPIVFDISDVCQILQTLFLHYVFQKFTPSISDSNKVYIFARIFRRTYLFLTCSVFLKKHVTAASSPFHQGRNCSVFTAV